MNASLNELLGELAEQLPGCLHTSVVDAQTGLALAEASKIDALDAAGTDAYHNDLYRLSELALSTTPLAQQVREVVLTSSRAVFVSLPIESSGYRWLVVTDRQSTVGFTQALMRKNLDRLCASLGALMQ